mmetsp:Transcript_7065/g.7972  ORF Transcript_7065/g.7972 Transcript_7065/m.7972 type:complete len:683 (-) Transcript_7065:200-2248(-)
MIATTSTAIADDAASNGTSQPYGNTAAANTTTTVKELSELLFSNRTTHQSSMKKSRVNFQASLVDKSKQEKQAERTTFRRIKEEKQQLFKNSQMVHRKLFFSKIESKEEKKAAHAALKSFMMEKKKKNGNGTTAATVIDDDVDPNLAGKVKELSEILLSNRKTHQASMYDSRLNCQASLAGKTPEEKKKERTIFRVIQQEKRQSFQNAQKKHRKSFFSNLESQDEKKAARAALKSLMMNQNKNNNNNDGGPGLLVGPALMRKGRPMKAARKAFRASLGGRSPIAKQQMRKAFRTEMKKVRQESFRDRNADRREARQTLNESLEGLILAERRIKRQQFRKEEQERQVEFRDTLAKAFKDAQESMDSSAMMPSEKENEEEEEVITVTMNEKTLDDVIVDKAIINKKMFLVFVGANGDDGAAMKKEWQATHIATKKGIAKSVAAFEAWMDGLSHEDQRFNWNARLAECRERFMSTLQKINDSNTSGGGSASSFLPEDAIAARKARMELIHFRRAKRNAMMMTSNNNKAGAVVVVVRRPPPVRMMNNNLNKEFETELVEEGFTKDLVEFTSSLNGLSEKEQNIQWKNRIQNLQREARKARAMVVMTRETAAAARSSRIAAVTDEEKVEGLADDDSFIEDQKHVANDSFVMVIVDGMEEPESTNIDVHENGKNVEEDEDFVRLDWEI